MDNLDLMRKRLEFQGGIRQEDRMINDKYRTFLKTLQYSYQGCDVHLVQPYEMCYAIDPFEDYKVMEQGPQWRALINPDKLKQDYDDKILSIDYAAGYRPGDVFTWEGTNTQWLIYLQALTEDAYFRGEIRLCKYLIKFKDEHGVPRYTWAAIRGPMETEIESIQKNQIRIDEPNLSLNILMPKNKYTLAAFDRYERFLFAGRAWQVKAPDSISVSNVIEVAAEEYYIDKDKDNIEGEIANGFEIKQLDPNEHTHGPKIEGATFIKPKIEELYTAPAAGGTWCIKEKGVPVCLKSISATEARVKWQKTTHGQFTLTWTDGEQTLEKIIVVESLF